MPACRRIEKHELISAVYKYHADVFATARSCGKLWQVLASFQIIAMIRFGCVTIYRNYRSFAIGSIFTSMCCVVGNTDFSKEGPLCGASRDCRYLAMGAVWKANIRLRHGVLGSIHPSAIGNVQSGPRFSVQTAKDAGLRTSAGLEAARHFRTFHRGFCLNMLFFNEIA